MRSLFGGRRNSYSSPPPGKAASIKITGGTSTSTPISANPLNYDALIMALEVLAESFDLMSPVPGITRASKSTSEATSLSTRLWNMSITEYDITHKRHVVDLLNQTNSLTSTFFFIFWNLSKINKFININECLSHGNNIMHFKK
mgnify:CR=1 FL=1